MKKLSIIIAVLLSLSGCAPVLEILDLFYEPSPICDRDSAGTEWDGKVCLKYSDNDYRWVLK